QGFSKGIKEDAAAIHIFAERGLPTFIASSFSKSFSLYSERIGALTVTTSDEAEQVTVTSQLKRMVRAIYSSPPSHGARIVQCVLADDELRALWEKELGEMRDRIKAMREKFVKLLNEKQSKVDFEFIIQGLIRIRLPNSKPTMLYIPLIREEFVSLRSMIKISKLQPKRLLMYYS